MSDQLTPAAAGDAGRILLVDDEPTNLDILRETLAGPNYRLFVARSGEEALRVAPLARPSIVLLLPARTRSPIASARSCCSR